MPTPLQFLAWFASDDGYGWTEIHYRLVGEDNPDLAPWLVAFDTLMVNFRRPLLGRDRALEGVRVSYPTAAGEVASSPLWYSPPKYPGNQREGCAPNLAAKVRYTAAGNVHFGDTYLRGFWDVVEVDERLDFTTAGGMAWKGLLDQYNQQLINGAYGFMGTDVPNTRRGRVTNYTTDPQGFVTFTLVIEQGPALPAVGTYLPLRVARLNSSKSILNDTHTVRVVGADSVQTVVPTASGPFVSAGTFVITALTFYQYQAMQYAKLAKRKPGRPFGRSPGRLKARARS